MKTILLALLVLAATFAWANPAWPEILEARYDYTACNVEWAKDYVDLREDCAEEENVSIFDSSEYIEEIDENLADLKDAAEEGDQLEFGLTSFALGADMIELGLVVVGDAFQNKTLSFFACVDEGKDPLKSELEECRAEAYEKGESATTHYMENDLDYANDIIEELDEQGIETSEMESVVEEGDELLEDIPAAFDSQDNVEIRALNLRHSRLVDLFHLERMSAITEYAIPIVEAGNYQDKEELVDDMEDLNEEIEGLLVECEYSSEVENNFEYGSDNLDCWAETWDIWEEFNSLKMRIIFGG